MPASAASVAWNTDSVQISLTSSVNDGTYNLQLGASRQGKHSIEYRGEVAGYTRADLPGITRVHIAVWLGCEGGVARGYDAVDRVQYHDVRVLLLALHEFFQDDHICTSPAECTCGFSRHVLPAADTGHFKFSVTRDGVSFNTSCISYGAPAGTVAAALDALDPFDDLGGSAVVRQGDGSSSAYDYGFVYYISASNSSQNLVSSIEIELAGSGVEYGCARLSTLGYWEDGLNWDAGVAPVSTDEVGCGCPIHNAVVCQKRCLLGWTFTVVETVSSRWM